MHLCFLHGETDPAVRFALHIPPSFHELCPNPLDLVEDFHLVVELELVVSEMHRTRMGLALMWEMLVQHSVWVRLAVVLLLQLEIL